MKALRQLGFLKLNFRQDAPPEEEGRVLALFRNRAELKKAYGELQEEIYRLQDRMKQQEGATQRVQEMLSALEGRLGMSDTAYPALVFYQLRRLWQSGRELIEQFVADLTRQQEDRERRAHLAEHNRRQFTRRQSVEKTLRSAESQAAEMADSVAGSSTGSPPQSAPPSVPTPLWSKRAQPPRLSSRSLFPSLRACRWKRAGPSISQPSPMPKCC